jgi:Rod binding domain-containing protein
MVPNVANPVAAASGSDPRPRNIPQAAQQFEALLIAQMLKSAHEEGSGGWLGAGDDQAGSSMVGLAEEHLAQAMASKGGFGLASRIAKGLERADTAAKAPPAGAGPAREP